MHDYQPVFVIHGDGRDVFHRTGYPVKAPKERFVLVRLAPVSDSPMTESETNNGEKARRDLPELTLKK